MKPHPDGVGRRSEQQRVQQEKPDARMQTYAACGRDERRRDGRVRIEVPEISSAIPTLNLRSQHPDAVLGQLGLDGCKLGFVERRPLEAPEPEGHREVFPFVSNVIVRL